MSRELMMAYFADKDVPSPKVRRDSGGADHSSKRMWPRDCNDLHDYAFTTCLVSRWSTWHPLPLGIKLC